MMKQFDHYLCNPVVGAVPGNLAGDVVAFQDVESSDQGNAGMRGWGCHHMVSFRSTHTHKSYMMNSMIKLMASMAKSHKIMHRQMG